jgi:diguanylate cyclase (GGDEF)-like protein
VEPEGLEVIELRRRIAALKEEARKNEEAWKRSQRREMELLEADTLATLLVALTDGLRRGYGLEAVTLVLADPHHEVRHLLMSPGKPPDPLSAVSFVDSVHAMAPQLVPSARPWLGPYAGSDHSLLFPGEAALKSVALLPLTRQGRIVGSLNLGSVEPRRFTRQLATDFLHHLASIAAFCLENAVNRARLVRSGFTDVLTGWHNRRYFQTRLHEELARSQRDESSLVCLMIDVDYFKQINDRHGHLVGDEVLRQLAHCINAEVRESDVSARYGGEEFVILLPGTALAAGRALAERIRSAVANEAFELGALCEPLPVTVSIGVAEYRPDARTEDLKLSGERLIALADLALYEAKAGGRNSVAQAANG